MGEKSGSQMELASIAKKLMTQGIIRITDSGEYRITEYGRARYVYDRVEFYNGRVADRDAMAREMGFENYEQVLDTVYKKVGYS
ncbi:MAG: hypothetical protein UX87_C0032G0005 [Candidatus Amesbacteria bacterium GW2011_GWA1_47_16]|uniref:ArnR1-like winged helix-turn-helix domain-containing protein n=4 Tax=Candidatus Amesiibacteriota TaxID=1752730 RepID=A0A0G1UZQ3_9BACT|nr:MAG: hypothetical protein UX87_C0032G0005 [Candidatus Amesbacteria bacterium GW2011_GWA1_47_16]KKU63175.1 MAG: hypothetical protein UX86_C0031G0005 [Candidatus Amesbacteria bacterium GW2011_GWC1_47_15]KKU97705.1 MAG: hypothetical protein UY28_C0016G0014 [Candidatus Amesbacteria bacterium GW2011_GWB1_48_13]OGC97890.1 MAG: hypothetical protein A2701_03145 [Candidatus Amesbacteria bacterium RIFCSPHIGHO2_01_FULL_47_34]OGD01396.1 MAG: hypothetical protein A2972_04190 [Candidatus Amesbacteria bact